MKKGLVILVGLVLLAGFAFGDTWVLENTKGKVPVALLKDPIQMGVSENVGNLPDQKNIGFNYGTYMDIEAASPVKINKIEVKPNGYIGVHEGGNIYVCLVTQGSGVCGLYDNNRKKVGEIKFKAGDVIVTKPYTLHDWKIGPEGVTMIGVEQVISAGR